MTLMYYGRFDKLGLYGDSRGRVHPCDLACNLASSKLRFVSHPDN